MLSTQIMVGGGEKPRPSITAWISPGAFARIHAGSQAPVEIRTAPRMLSGRPLDVPVQITELHNRTSTADCTHPTPSTEAFN